MLKQLFDDLLEHERWVLEKRLGRGGGGGGGLGRGGSLFCVLVSGCEGSVGCGSCGSTGERTEEES